MFRIRTFESRTLSWWNGERDNIDMSPRYQRRGGLWSTYDKAFLIDSILNDYDIPKLYVADFTYVNTHLNYAGKTYAMIDGRQRFEAIFDFFDGKSTLDKNFVYLDEPDLPLGQLGYVDLVHNYPQIAVKFANHNLQVMSVISDEEKKIRELFVRMNRSKPLTGAEVRNAMIGAVSDFSRSIAEHPFFTTNVKFNSMRGQDKNAAAKLLLIEHRGKFVDTKKKQLDDFVNEGNDIDISCVEAVSARVQEVLDQMTEIFLKPDPLLNSPASLVLYYWLIRNNISSHTNSLRGYLLEFERDRKANRQVAKESPKNADATLLLYDTLNRSPDDQKSLERRYTMLHEGLSKFSGSGDS